MLAKVLHKQLKNHQKISKKIIKNIYTRYPSDEKVISKLETANDT